MTQYLGICLVVIITTLCIGVLSGIVSESIFKQIEAHRKRVSERRWAEFGRFLIKFRQEFKSEIDELIKKMEINASKKSVDGAKEICDKIDEMDQKLKKE